MLDDLYSSKLLTLAASIPHTGRLESPQASSTQHARLCGSVVTVDVNLDEAGSVGEFAQDVKACALGQASASVLGAGILGATLDEVVSARDALRALLAGEALSEEAFGKRFSDLVIFSSVQDYKARHASVMLAFEATVEAMELARQSQTTAA